MKDKLIQIRVDLDFIQKLEYLRKVYGIKSISALIRFIVEKEYRKEVEV